MVVESAMSLGMELEDGLGRTVLSEAHIGLVFNHSVKVGSGINIEVDCREVAQANQVKTNNLLGTTINGTAAHAAAILFISESAMLLSITHEEVGGIPFKK